MCCVYGKSKHEKQTHLVSIRCDWPKESSPEIMLRSAHNFQVSVHDFRCVLKKPERRVGKDLWVKTLTQNWFYSWANSAAIVAAPATAQLSPCETCSWRQKHLMSPEARVRGSDTTHGIISYPAKSLTAANRWNHGLRYHSTPLSQLDPRLQLLGKCSHFSHPANF